MNGVDLDDLQRRAFEYFETFVHPETGLVADSSRPASDASIAAVGMALSSYPVAEATGWVRRSEVARRAVAVLRTLHRGRMDGGPGAIGNRGFFYHFLDMETGLRTRRCEVSTIDTAILVAGVLVAIGYFDRDNPVEREIRERGEAIYRGVDWAWALADGSTVSMGWRPGLGFHRTRWEGYSESLLLYILGLGSPTHPLPAESYRAWARHHRWKRIYGIELLYAGQLFVHALPHSWLDLRELRDPFMCERESDYFENSHRAVLVQQRYAVRNPQGFSGYSADLWGISATDGPGPAQRTTNGRERRFWDYKGRGVPWGADDGTLSPTAVASCLPFAPDLVRRTLRGFLRLTREGAPSLLRSVNPTWGNGDGPWISKTRFGIDQGPVVLMIENHRTGLVWDLAHRSLPFAMGLERAGFRGGWLDAQGTRGNPPLQIVKS